ncbi:MAG: protein kinase [Planctomycetes bacterium]|nr:protein kinase [Planctomycetota bacterium]
MSGSRSAKSIFLLAADLSPEARSDFLNAQCADRPDLRSEVESLLLHDPGKDVLDDSPAEIRQAHPTVLGPYTIERLIARGGSASVYAARQESPSRRVALKVLRSDAAGAAWKRRFEREASILASLDHSGIAHFYAFGTTEAPDPRAYIAMELVEGQSITAFAQSHSVSVAVRLVLLALACDAVDYGHRKGVIHRDIKPSNILVSMEADASIHTARVRVVDFGVASMTDQGTEPHTTTGLLIGTPAYMSPEQVMRGPRAADARSDVYSLGVVLYELVTGRPPFGDDQSAAFDVLRQVVHARPKRLGLINPTFRGDLEIIASKALAHDPAARYQSAALMAHDLRQFVERRPILARRPSAGYVLRSFVRRNPSLAGALGACVLLLFAATGVSIDAAVRSRQHAARLASELGFWQQLAESLWNTPGSSQVRRQHLLAAVPHLEQLAGENPADLSITATLGRAYVAISDVEYEKDHLPEARVWREKAYSFVQRVALAAPNDVNAMRELARVTVLLGDLDKEVGDPDAMLVRYLEALDIQEDLARRLPDDPRVADDRYWSLQRIGDAYRRSGDVTAAARMLNLQWDASRRNYERWPDSPDAMYAQVVSLYGQSEIDKAAADACPPQAEEALVLARQLVMKTGRNRKHIKIFVQIASQVAWHRFWCKRESECDALYAECYQLIQQARGQPGDDSMLDDAYVDLQMVRAALLDAQGQFAGALRIASECLPIVRAAAAGSPGNPERASKLRVVEESVALFRARGNAKK